MDEYLFIEWAKLQADRRKLEREQRAAHPSFSAERGSFESHHEPVRKKWFAGQWRKWFAGQWRKWFAGQWRQQS